MTYFVHISRLFICFFLVQWMMVYLLRLLGSTYRYLVVNDYIYIYVTAMVMSALVASDYLLLKVLLFFIAIGIYLLQWVNIVVLKYFGIKVNFSTIAIFFRDICYFNHEVKDLFPELLSESKIWLFPFFTIAVYLALFFLTTRQFVFVWVAFLCYFLATLTKSKINKQTVFFWLLLFLISQLIVLFIRISLLPTDDLSALICVILFILGFLCVLLLYFFGRHRRLPFYKLPTMLWQQFSQDKIDVSLLQQPPVIKPADQELVNVVPGKLAISRQFSQCVGASIILITMESLSNRYFAEEQTRAEHLPFFTQLAENALVSEHHIVPSSLTNNALRALYAGTYLDNDSFAHLQKLQTLGYQTCFLTSQKVSEFNMDRLLRQVGFTHIIDNVTVSKNPKHRISDVEFFGQCMPYLQAALDLQKPFFLHVMNNQTHGPYFTYDKKIHKRQQRYRQAVYESDMRFQRLFTELGAVCDLSNTMVVYTGDHGESFGEESYTSHANSILQPQIEVPFLLHHPRLSMKTIDFSSHFDVFPTLFDLLGERYDYSVLGNSLFGAYAKHCFVYSETRIGNTPSSFGVVTPQQKIYFDRHLKKYQLRDLKDGVLQDLDAQAYAYYLKLLLIGLQQRGLIY